MFFISLFGLVFASCALVGILAFGYGQQDAYDEIYRDRKLESGER